MKIPEKTKPPTSNCFFQGKIANDILANEQTGKELFFECNSYPEIAEKLSISRKAVKVHSRKRAKNIEK